MTDLSILRNAVFPVAGGAWAGDNSEISPDQGDLNYASGIGEKASNPPEPSGTTGVYLLRSEMNQLGDLANREFLFRSAGGMHTRDASADWGMADGYPKDAVLANDFQGTPETTRVFVEKVASNIAENKEELSDRVAWRVVSHVPDLTMEQVTFGADFSRPEKKLESTSGGQTYSMPERSLMFFSRPSPYSEQVEIHDIELVGEGTAGILDGIVSASAPLDFSSNQYPRDINGTSAAVIVFWNKDAQGIEFSDTQIEPGEYPQKEMGSRVISIGQLKAVVGFPEKTGRAQE